MRRERPTPTRSALRRPRPPGACPPRGRRRSAAVRHHGMRSAPRTLAILLYRTLKDGLHYQDPGAAAYDAQHRTRVLHRLRQRAANLGFSLLNRETGELLKDAVS